jgi:hypothetical protein
MTLALCLFCGSFKMGALVPCPHCGRGPTGELALDISFTDHYYPPETLKALSGNLRLIHAVAPTPELALWCFLDFVAEHNSWLRVNIPGHLKPQIKTLRDAVPLPPIVLQPPPAPFAPKPAQEPPPLALWLVLASSGLGMALAAVLVTAPRLLPWVAIGGVALIVGGRLAYKRWVAARIKAAS